MWDEIQRQTDYERGQADLRERFTAYDHTPVIIPENKQPRLMPSAEYWAKWDEREAEIEAEEQLKDRNGIPPSPVTRVRIFQ